MRRLIQITVAAAALMLAFCSWAVELRVGVSADITSVDPHFVNLFPNLNATFQVFDPLVRLDPDSRLIPGLAISWKPIDDNTWEFKLRQGVKFHDGSTFSAEDVAFTIERIGKIPNSPGPFTVYTKAIKEMQVVDAHTIRFKTAGPYPLMPNDLTTILIVSKKVVSGLATEDFDSGKAMVGTGAFRFARYLRGDRVEFTRNDDYWDGKAAWDKLTFRILPNDATRIAALLSGDVDAIENIPTPDLPKIRANKDLRVLEKVSHRIIFFHLDSNRDNSPFVTDKSGKPTAKNPMKDLRVRQAMSKAINRQAIKDRVMEGLSIPTANLLPSPMFGHVPDLKPDAYDPEGAKKLLAQAGYPDGFGITLHAPNNRYVNDEQIAQAVAQMLTRVGIQTKVEAMPMNVYLPRANKLEFSFALLGWGAGTGEASSPLRAHLTTYNPDKGMGNFAWGRYSNAKVDQLVEQALHTLNDAEREKLLQQAVRLAITDLGIIPLHHQINTWAMRKGFTYTARTDEFTLAHQFKKAD